MSVGLKFKSIAFCICNNSFNLALNLLATRVFPCIYDKPGIKVFELACSCNFFFCLARILKFSACNKTP